MLGGAVSLQITNSEMRQIEMEYKDDHLDPAELDGEGLRVTLIISLGILAAL